MRATELSAILAIADSAKYHRNYQSALHPATTSPSSLSDLSEILGTWGL
jgi:hypothetical protein